MPDPHGIWNELVDGAARGYQTHPVVDPDDHSPVAIVLTCSDARVPPSLVFDQPRNRLFEVRVAGGRLDPTVREAIDFAVEHLGVPVVVVLGHEKCAAVQLAVDVRDGAADPGPLAGTVTGLRSTIGDASGLGAVRAHVRATVETLREDLPDDTTIVGAITHLASDDLEIVVEPR